MNAAADTNSPQKPAPLLIGGTPLPWAVEDELTIAMAADGGAVIATVLSYNDFPCADEDERETIEAEARANAVFIVRACNTHFDLVIAAHRAIAALAANGAPNCEAAKELRAAIAKAEGR